MAFLINLIMAKIFYSYEYLNMELREAIDTSRENALIEMNTSSVSCRKLWNA